jgi:bacterioferritin-associated ferredoxin
MFVCCCLGVTDRAIRGAIDQGAQSVDDVVACTGAGSRCGSCRPEIAEMVQRAQGLAGGGQSSVEGCPVKRRLPFLTASSSDDVESAA